MLLTDPSEDLAILRVHFRALQQHRAAAKARALGHAVLRRLASGLRATLLGLALAAWVPEARGKIV